MLSGKEESEVEKVCQVFCDYENCRKPRDVSFEVAYAALRSDGKNEYDSPESEHIL